MIVIGRTPQQTADGDIFVELRPMNPDAATDQTPVGSILGARVAEPGKPLHGHVDRPPVFQAND